MPFRVAAYAGVLLAASMFVHAQAPEPQADPAPQVPPPSQAPSPRVATETNRGSIIPFLEGTDVFATSDEDVVFEANIQPHLIGFQNFTDSLEVTREKSVSVSVSGTPGVRIRMFTSTSRPVRTPSYQPRVNLQLLWIRDRDRVTSALKELHARLGLPERKDDYVRMGLWEAHVIVGHHSNGQDGCFFEGQERDQDDVCQPPVDFDPDLVNRTDGSFSTNFIRTGINYRRNWLLPVEQGSIDSIAVKELTFRGEVEWHPRAWVDEEMVDYYGRVRIRAAADWARSRTGARGWQCPKRLQVGGALEYIDSPPGDVSHWVQTAQVSCFPTENGGWGLFVRVYNGQDYYNLGFVEEIRRLQVGVTFNPDGFFRFVRPQ